LVLERLCRLTTELLECDASYTYLHDSGQDVYQCVASHGPNADQLEVLRFLELPAAAVESTIRAFGSEDVAIAPGLLFRSEGTSLAIGLRRGEALVGIHFATWVRRMSEARRFVSIANRIGQLGSLALENARLLQELGRANSLKSDFLATVSHEFRTPLNVILGYNELLLEDTFGNLNAQQRDSLHRVKINAEQLLDLINAILDVTRLEGGRSPVNVELIDIERLFGDVDDDLRDLRASKPAVGFELEVGEQLPPLRSDPAKVKLVLKNLISNAIKFTPEGKVSVAAASADDGVVFRISDTGVGIAREVQDAIFEPFRQLDGAGFQPFAGVGLGLYIVRRLIDLLHGRVTLESDVGRGSSFSVWLPSTLPEAMLKDRLEEGSILL
jgi:signal transduction histidine kinase